ncbi:angio-associated migratory cell protein [Daphnia magna]|uniref:Angio-associated migratory cell protein n=1 Tax=Daphnia magna TaxID=35525 RepID=A0ABQ9YRS7_9CRUS|nr:angio-associated migratory cell protein [Daphnia magna]XP_032798138.2 angio-associated migratory cell protein [Daphnia magna]KAK4003322.1 hypothetical protein OUZ56_005093 [Daphnia magna]
MGENNTPPVSPRDQGPNESDEEGIGTQNEDDDFEVIEVYEENEDEEDVADGEGREEGEGEMDEADVPDDAVITFKQHSGSVFCCSIEPKESKLVVSGGEDDKAFVWDITDGQVVFECGNHQDSVTSALFSHDGCYLATADMSGFIQVWKMATKSVVWTFETGDLNWLDWHPASHILFAGTVAGETWFWKIPSGDCKTLPGHGERNECGKILPDGRRIAVGYVDGSVKVFDLKTLAVLQHLSGGQMHTNAVSSIDCHRDNNLMVSGSLDSTAKLYNTQTGKLLCTLSCLGVGSSEEESSVEAVSFCPETSVSLVVTGTLSGKISFWDIPTQIERQSYDQAAGVVKLVWHPKHSHLLFSAGLDGVVRLIDSRSGTLVREYTGHTANILDIAISFDGYHLVTSSDDQTCRVFEVNVDH